MVVTSIITRVLLLFCLVSGIYALSFSSAGPTLDTVQPPSVYVDQTAESARDGGPIPGLDKVGVGYDIITGVFTQPLFLFESKTSEPWRLRNPLLSRTKNRYRYQVPQGVSVTSQEHTVVPHTTVLQDIDDYRFELAKRAGILAPAPAHFQLSQDVVHMRDLLKAKVCVITDEPHPLYTLRLEQDAKVLLLKESLLEVLKGLPKTPPPSGLLHPALSSFFRNFGTHYITSATFGGRLRTQYYVDRQYALSVGANQLQTLCELDLQAVLPCRFTAPPVALAALHETIPSTLSSFSKAFIRNIAFDGGNAPAAAQCGLVDAWLDSLDDDPVLLYFTLEEIYEVVPPKMEAERAVLKSSLETFLMHGGELASVLLQSRLHEMELEQHVASIHHAQSAFQVDQRELAQMAHDALALCHTLVDLQLTVDSKRRAMYGGADASLSVESLREARCQPLLLSLGSSGASSYESVEKGRCLVCSAVMWSLSNQFRSGGGVGSLQLSASELCAVATMPSDQEHCARLISGLQTPSVVQFAAVDLLHNGCLHNTTTASIAYESGHCPSLVACVCLGECAGLDSSTAGVCTIPAPVRVFDECNDAAVPPPDCVPNEDP
eukprot:gnl/Hemi2/4711_TR1631_c0_g1_i1.p1 gnl/Hemi2/4711_TR1631_c0_g1~~gnl/Hemi2/4711_TR1631_c0_g1_i1.p1  ORF type:complete len:606 (-),score=30.65 gnl/Hemi2/4711_TR1631_c0_g1_i1:96-1913(-)